MRARMITALMMTGSALLLPGLGRDAIAAPPTGNSVGSNHGCSVRLFDGDHFSDDSIEITKPGRYANLKKLPGAKQDWTDEADSLKVGAGATVTIWEHEGFKGASKTYQPGSEVPSVDEASSLELRCR